ncbi:MAG: L,D-transpeptidase family protein [Rhodobacteraceae bacterium]|nr:L,D-transpeptidase family protein [Paracoccaceae bacterium]
MLWPAIRRAVRRLILLAALVLAGLWLLSVYGPEPLPPPPVRGHIDLVVIEKSARRLLLFQNGTQVREYRIALGFTPEGDKDREGDGRTPEGRFRIDRRNAASAYHLSLGLDYPHSEDRARAAAGGYSPGGDIFIHGQPNALFGLATLPYDWTAGCIAVSDAAIEEIWQLTPIGTEVEIRP